jgi:LmbE family N-acetylglucosaminyl deacetylase
VVVLAVGCHPDDIELMMSGTLFLLRDAGWEVHYVNLANGGCGADRQSTARVVRMRRAEAREAATLLGAVFHESWVNDLEVLYEPRLVRRVTALVREVKPRIILTQSLEDYMEDHMNAALVTVTAAFCRGMRNFHSVPRRPPFSGDVMVYHGTPHILTDAMRRPIVPEMYVDVGSVLERKRNMLACHRSQKEWLDHSQGFDSYLQTMEQITADVGRLSGRFTHAEGWRRHSHVGFSARDGNPLADALGDRVAMAG